MRFSIISRGSPVPAAGRNEIYLKVDLWNDYSFITMFSMYVRDSEGELHDVGSTKIGFKGQTTEQATYQELPTTFESLDERFFSVGQDADFYKKIAVLGNGFGREILRALRDLAMVPSAIDGITDEKVFGTSLLRYVSLSTLMGQFARVLNGHAELTDYSFQFVKPSIDGFDDVQIDFQVKESSIPSTNIHAIIGRNGVGKTTLLNGMIEAVVGEGGECGFNDLLASNAPRISSSYFSSLVSVSFSAFDPFTPPMERNDPAKGASYFYIGLKTPGDADRLQAISELRHNCSLALFDCFANGRKFERWTRAIEQLNSDEVFASMDLHLIREIFDEIRSIGADIESRREEFFQRIDPFLTRMSSGHAVVLLTITRLVSRMEEKTLVLLDEPESHLHPPLLSAFLRALADLLRDRNGVAIIATHSPVVLQEIPRSCVWKIYRRRLSIFCSRPEIETFGENVGVLTSEVFGLEVARSGFHDLLAQSVRNGQDFAGILAEYKGQIGFEGKAVLGALIAERDRGGDHASS